MLPAVADDHTNTIERRGVTRCNLSIASGDYNFCLLIFSVRAADKLTGLKIGKCSNCAGVDDVNIGNGVEGNH